MRKEEKKKEKQEKMKGEKEKEKEMEETEQLISFHVSYFQNEKDSWLQHSHN